MVWGGGVRMVRGCCVVWGGWGGQLGGGSCGLGGGEGVWGLVLCIRRRRGRLGGCPMG